MEEKNITIDDIIIEACKIEDEDFRIKTVHNLLKLKDSGNEIDSLFAKMKDNLKGW